MYYLRYVILINMKAVPLETNNPIIRLVEPDIERDAPLGVGWLEGVAGRDTLRLMGVSNDENRPSSIDLEKERVQGFISNEHQLNWMIEYDGKVVGSIWVDLLSTEELPSPSIHIMIGDPDVRGKGLGSASFAAVLSYLKHRHAETVYSRHLLDNEGSKRLLQKMGFQNLGEPYITREKSHYQNVSLDIETDKRE